MHIPVKPLKQDERDCTLTCIMMLLDFYGCRITRQEVESSIKTTEAGHIYMVEVARFLHTLDLKVDCLSYNLYYTDPQNANLSKDKFIKTLEKEQDIVTDDWFKERIKVTIEAIKQGVNYSIQKPTIGTMVSYLEQGIPILLAVSSCALSNEQGDIYLGHDIILTGVGGNMVYYIDPIEGSEKTMSFDDLMFVTLARKVVETSAYMVVIKKA